MAKKAAKFRLEMRVGQDVRDIEADAFAFQDQWMIFYRKPPTGGTKEYWRVQTADVVSMETIR